MKKLDLTKFLASFSFYSDEDRLFRYTRDLVLGREQYVNTMLQMILQQDINIDEIASTLWNTSANIRHLSNSGHLIGLHSHTHPTDLQSLSVIEQASEYEQNLKILKSITHTDILTMSHPCNSFSNETIQILRELNINCGFRSNMDDYYNSELEYPRLDHILLMKSIN